MKHTLALVILAVLFACPAFAQRGQRGQRGGQQPAKPSAPTPRAKDGLVILGVAPGDKGFWNVGTVSVYGRGPNNLPTNLLAMEIPFQPWAKALFEYRQATQTKDDPHARCVPDGGIHFWQ